MHTNDYTLGPELKGVKTLYYIIMESSILPVKSDLVTLSLKVRSKVVNVFMTPLQICMKTR